MNAPIAEIPPPAPRRAPNQAPLSLSVMVVIGLVLGAVDMVLMLLFPVRQVPEISETWENGLMFGAMLLLYFPPLLLVWRGFNWARWLMIALNGLGLLFIFMPDDSQVPLPLVREVMNWLYLPYNLAFIIFLLTPAMRRHFKGTPAP